MYLATFAEYQQALKATQNGGKPLVVDFTASWCPPCKKIGPVFESLAKNFAEQLVLRKLDVDANKEGKVAAKIQAMPTFIVYRDGVEVDRLRGAKEDELKQLLQRAASSG